MEPIAAEEEMEEDRDKAVAVAIKAEDLREVLSVLAYARNVGIASRMSEACPACR
jgi:hypothetical protein